MFLTASDFCRITSALKKHLYFIIVIFNKDKKRKNVYSFGNKYYFGTAQRSREGCVFISVVGIRGIYLSLTLGTVKFHTLV